MLEELETYMKLAIDVERSILAGGGEYHADCEEALLEDGSRRARHILALRAFQMSNRILECSGLLDKTTPEAKQAP